VEDIVHSCSYFENDAEFYWKPVKLFEGRGDVRPTTKAENEPGGCILDPRGASVDTGRPTRTELQ